MAENKEAKMDLRLRPYKGKRPQLGKWVYIGRYQLADDVHAK